MGARIIGFLSIALVPIGLVAYFQTTQLDAETRARTQLSLTDRTEAAVAAERALLTSAFGAAKALGTISQVTGGRVDQCSQALVEYSGTEPDVTFAALMDTTGNFVCASVGGIPSRTDIPEVLEALGEPRQNILPFEQPTISDEPIVAIFEPVFRDGFHIGHVVISIPLSALRDLQPADQTTGASFIDVALINRSGDMVTSGLDRATLEPLLPGALGLSNLPGQENYSFLSESADGVERIYVVAAIVPDLLYAVSIWDRNSPELGALEASTFAKALPLVMWAASVVVAYLAVNRLVIRHIRTLRYQMRSFARDRRLPAQSSAGDMALELRDMENDFLLMSDSILRDEAQLENALREKTILLKEVHHRVKNNLQLISSIMNMQIRQSETDETKRVLRRLQERVRGLAAIHRQLYRTADLGRVDVRELLEELTQHVAVMSEQDDRKLEIVRDLDPVRVYPDQAMPLALLTAEAVANAEKYIQRDASGRARIAVRLKQSADKEVTFEVSNTSDPEQLPVVDRMGGLGQRLISAFATQLGGELNQGLEADTYRVTVTFRISDFKPEVVDY
ncbi:sensor histidine kinase [Roseivivax lentus]|uniref:sensor histidine kinase n=1 Tax=Roseivivax lentus TaxID=633194 RepID=UPI0013563509|nr:sensor histidine kinase [Roseivivax lentus]